VFYGGLHVFSSVVSIKVENGGTHTLVEKKDYENKFEKGIFTKHDIQNNRVYDVEKF